VVERLPDDLARAFEPLGPQTLKGKAQPMEVWALID